MQEFFRMYYSKEEFKELLYNVQMSIPRIAASYDEPCKDEQLEEIAEHDETYDKCTDEGSSDVEENRLDETELNEEQQYATVEDIVIEPAEPRESCYLGYNTDELEQSESAEIEMLEDCENEKSEPYSMQHEDCVGDDLQVSGDAEGNEESNKRSGRVCCGCPGLQFPTKAALVEHSNAVHRKERILNNLRPYECDICYIRYSKYSWLVHHQTKPYREKKFKCRKCDAQFLGRSALLNHNKSMHVRERSYVCDVCQKGFYTSSTLISHRQVHSEKKLKCKTCSKTFVRQADLLGHEIAHLNERPYGCDLCQKQFKTRAHLRNHQQVHTGERTKRCKYCDKGFLTYTDRRVHELQHENIQPFLCPHCNKHYGRNYKLQLHIRKAHTGERPFKCDACSERFFQQWELTAHQRTKHGLEKKDPTEQVPENVYRER
ncbi:zinc finger protein 235-like [Anopheles nili]|uniref:zinc finger protein 235-like n=1 Tax=Anopheles nili TaxID=185578 RepID=UPI00237BF5A6|nr:zinc finger protein 235-like [Anopheles nili]